MGVKFTDSGVCVGSNCPRLLSFQEIAVGWKSHISGDPLTNNVAEFADTFVRNDMPESQAYLFVRMVCAWGGLGRGNPAKIRNSIFLNGHGEIWLRSLLKTGRQKSIEGKYEEALRAFDQINGLGISFTSKLLRFLAPDHAAVLDSIIRDSLGYANSAAAYREFVTDCMAIREKLKTEKKRPDGGDWRTTDIEMGIFMNVRS